MKESADYYLRKEVYFEPLLHNWYVWPYFLPPITAAMHMTGRCLRLMKSFIANPELHISASADSTLIGGSFVNCGIGQIGQVRELVHNLEENYEDYFQVRESVKRLNELLSMQRGLSMERLYEQIPAALKGYVELVYDMNHNASFRVIEGLTYRGSLYKLHAQSAMFGLLSRVKERPFVLSSPRLPDENHLHADIRFDDKRLDTLFESRRTPKSSCAISELFKDINVTGGLSINDLFTTEPPAETHRNISSGLRVTYLGHAGLMIETKRSNILVDPIIASRDSANANDAVSFSGLPERIDYICITHAHMDHACIEILLQLRHKTKTVLVPRNGGGCIADPSLKLMLQQIGFHVHDVDDMEELLLPDGKVQALPFVGEHADLSIRSKTIWYFELSGYRIIANADAVSLDESMCHRIHQVTGNVDMLFVGMECKGAPMSWLYGPLFTKPIPRDVNESRRFNGSDYASASRMVEIFKPRGVYIYALGLEPWFKYFMGIEYSESAPQFTESERLLGFCAERGVAAERLFGKRIWSFE